MRLKEIIQNLSQEDRTALATNYDILPEELENYFTQPDIVKNNYTILSKRLRKIVNYLFRANGLLVFNEFRKKMSATKQDLKFLQERALIFSLPNTNSPQKIVLPLEYLFILDVPENDPLSWISLLNNLQIETLRQIAQFNSLNYNILSKPICASIIYEYFTENIENTITSLSQAENDILRFVIQYDGKVSASEFFRRFQINSHKKISYLDINIRDLYGTEHDRRPSYVQKLFLKGLLIPILQNSSHSIQTIATSSETYKLAAEEYIQECEKKKQAIAKKMQANAPNTPILSNKKQIIQDIKKILLIIENSNIRITQSGIPYKNELRKIYKDFKLDEDYTSFLFNYLSYMELIKPHTDKFEVASTAADFLNLPLKNIYLLSNNFLMYSLHSIDEFLALNLDDIINLILHILKEFKENFSSVSLFLEYAHCCGSFIRLVEAMKSQEQRFYQICHKILKRMFWLGLLESKNDFEFVRLSAAGQYVFYGRIKHFQMDDVEEEKFSVLSNNDIVAPFNTRFEILQRLASFATINSMDVTIHFNLNKTRLIQAYHKGLKIKDIYAFLEQYSKTPLPQTILYLLQELGEKEGEVELIPASGYIKIRDQYLLEKIKIHLRQYILEAIGDNRIILRPDLNLYHLEKQLKQKGYFLKTDVQKKKLARASNSKLVELLESIEPPEINQEDLNFSNPAYDKDNIKKLLAFAITYHLQVRIEYQNESLSTSVRKIDPKKIHSNILEAYCYSRESSRAFRIDRIQWAELLN